ncbi:MAG: hypothetical protein OXC94_02315 [Chloroflexi bacterium]|nr:hypothetical protein [Chloroflexota bacterium]
MSERRLLPAEVRVERTLEALPRRAAAARRRRALALVLSRTTPAVQGALAAVALTLAAERVLRAAGSVVLSVVSTAPRPEVPARRAARRRTVVTELTILERRFRR